MESVPQQPPIQDVKVKLLLTGGHQYTVYLRSDEPLFYNLMQAIVARSQKQDVGLKGLFQIPIDKGRAALCFPSEHLVGILTEPPIFVRPTEDPET